jgi:hypothetical protein
MPFNKKQESILFFAGYPVVMRVVGNEVLVNCKNVTGTFSQAKAFLSNSNPTNVYPWGIKTTVPSFLTNEPGGDVRIACIQDTKEQFMKLYYECENLLGI